MSLKNIKETKLLMEDWRRVLKEGLYEEDPELLEEGLGQNLSALAIMGIMSFPSAAVGKISGKSEAQNEKAAAAAVMKLTSTSNPNTQLKYAKLIKKINDPNDHELTQEEEDLFDQMIIEANKTLKPLFTRAKELIKEKKRLSKELAEITGQDEDISPLELLKQGTNDSDEVSTLKSDLDYAIKEMNDISYRIFEYTQQGKGEVQIAPDGSIKVGGRTFGYKKPTIRSSTGR